jgi:phosphoglycerate dehydrogenase-like enzyme
VRVVVEEDPILRTVPVILDPNVATDREAAVAEFFRHDIPEFLDWRDGLRTRIPGLFPAEVVFASNHEEFVQELGRADAVIIEALMLGDAELAAAPYLRAGLKFGAIPSNIDLRACQARGVVVEVQRRRVNVAVAEHAMGLLLALAKRLPELDGVVTAEALTRAGFDISPFDRRFTGNSNFARVTGLSTLAGATIAIVGFGEIGREIARRAAAFEMRVLYSQRHRLDAFEEWSFGATYGSMTEVLAEADFVSVNLPLTDDTRGILDSAALARMKPGAILVNVSRAELVDRAALVEALDSGHLGGLGLDVGYEEPILADDVLLGRPNVLITPHSAVGSRMNAIWDMEDMYAKLWRAVTRAR